MISDTSIETPILDDSPSDSEYVRHQCFGILKDGLNIGTALMSVVDYGAIEDALTSYRWIKMTRGYLGMMPHGVLDPDALRARLHPKMAGLRGSHRRIAVIDDLAFNDVRVDIHKVLPVIFESLRDTLLTKVDFIALPSWRYQAESFSLSPVRMVNSIGARRVSILSDEMLVVSLAPELDHDEPPAEEDETPGPAVILDYRRLNGEKRGEGQRKPPAPV